MGFLIGSQKSSFGLLTNGNLGAGWKAGGKNTKRCTRRRRAAHQRRGRDLNPHIPKETGSQGQRSTRLCHRGLFRQKLWFLYKFLFSKHYGNASPYPICLPAFHAYKKIALLPDIVLTHRACQYFQKFFWQGHSQKINPKYKNIADICPVRKGQSYTQAL